MRNTVAALGILVAASIWTTPARGQEPFDFRVEEHGVPLPGCQFMYDAGFEVIDWNRDGLPDLYFHDTASVGKGAVYLNSGTIDKPCFRHAIIEPYNNTETQPQTIEHTIARAYGDLNGDGLRDAIFYDGQFRYCPNTGTPTGPNLWHLWNKSPGYFPGSDRMIKENARYVTGPQSMFWKNGVFARQVVTFTLADWDSDGLLDLIVCRFDDESPGVRPLGVPETWGPWGRFADRIPDRLPQADGDFSGPLEQAPPRSTVWYRNVGSATQPHFDAGVVFLTADGRPVVAPNPVVFDVDGDGRPDLVSTETPYSSNAFRVDWPTSPHVNWYRRGKDNATLMPAAPLTDDARRPIPAGTMVRFASLTGGASHDLLVLDGHDSGSVRLYRNAAAAGKGVVIRSPASTLSGRDFLRFEYSTQPLIVDWFAPGSRDLILHGTIDHHCKWALRRTALYRNVAKKPGEIEFRFEGWVNFNGDPAMVPTSSEERPYEVYGSSISVVTDRHAQRRFAVISVGGKVFHFSNRVADGLTFTRMTRLDIPFESNRRKGWQELTINASLAVRYLRLGNDRNGMGNIRDSLLHVIRLEAIDQAGRNVIGAAARDRVKVEKTNSVDSPYYAIDRAGNMLDPENANSDRELRASSFGFFKEDAKIDLGEQHQLAKVRFLLSDRDTLWYELLAPFTWQGKLVHKGHHPDDLWYHYVLKASADGKEWQTIADRSRNEMFQSCPLLADWDGDGRLDLVLGYTSSNGIYPHSKRYRLYRNLGSNLEPRFGAPLQAIDSKSDPIVIPAQWSAVSAQATVCVTDLNGDNRPDLLVAGPSGGNGIALLQNTGEAPGEFRFADPVALASRGLYFQYAENACRNFTVADVDGDGLPDLLNNNGYGTYVFKGVARRAPVGARNVKLGGADPRRDEWLRFDAGTDATGYEIRYSQRQPVDALVWDSLPAIRGTLAADRPSPHEVLLDHLPRNGDCWIAIRLTNASGASPMSDTLRVRADKSSDFLVHASAGVTLDSESPDAVASPDARALVIRATEDGKTTQKVVLLKFDELPSLNVSSAELVLWVDRSIQEDANQMPGPLTMMISASELGADWNPREATWKRRRAGVPWASNALDAGGEFLAYAEPVHRVDSHGIPLRWDVTAAVQRAKQLGRQSVTFLVRLDYTGHYVV